MTQLASRATKRRQGDTRIPLGGRLLGGPQAIVTWVQGREDVKPEPARPNQARLLGNSGMKTCWAMHSVEMDAATRVERYEKTGEGK